MSDKEILAIIRSAREMYGCELCEFNCMNGTDMCKQCMEE